MTSCGMASLTLLTCGVPSAFTEKEMNFQPKILLTKIRMEIVIIDWEPGMNTWVYVCLLTEWEGGTGKYLAVHHDRQV